MCTTRVTISWHSPGKNIQSKSALQNYLQLIGTIYTRKLKYSNLAVFENVVGIKLIAIRSCLLWLTIWCNKVLLLVGICSHRSTHLKLSKLDTSESNAVSNTNKQSTIDFQLIFPAYLWSRKKTLKKNSPNHLFPSTNNGLIGLMHSSIKKIDFVTEMGKV